MGNLDYFNHCPDTGIFSGLRPLPGKEGWLGCAVLHVSGIIFSGKRGSHLEIASLSFRDSTNE